MTAMQKQVGVQRAILPDADSFDMWHDYMNLGRLLVKLDGGREANRGDAEVPKEEPTAAAPRSRVRASSVRQNFRTSTETGSVSSLSDDSSSGTSSDYYCRFCKQNGESAKVYRSHRLKSNDGKVVCPILWSYTCPTCGATGDRAHTRKYCPQAQRPEAARMPPGSRFW